MAALMELAADAFTVEKGSSTNTTKRRHVSRGRRSSRSGPERLGREASRTVGKKSKEIVGALSDKATKGDLPSVRALVEFAGGIKPQAEPTKKRHGRSAAQELIDDLRLHGEWKGEQEEGFGEIGFGGVEPEGLY